MPLSASSTVTQKPCGSNPPRGIATQAVLSASLAARTQERKRNVLPLPAGAETSVTRAAPASRSKSSRRETIPPREAADAMALSKGATDA